MITIENVSYAYQHGSQLTPILHNINLQIEAGDFVAIQGPSGSGKSTFLYLMSGLMQSQQGSIYVEDTDLKQLSNEQLAEFRNKHLGFIFQHFHLLPRMTVLDNILLPTLYPSEIANPSDVDRQRAIELATQLGIGHRLHHTPNELSGGEQQRVAIARALIRDCKLLLADEPTGNLDSKSTQQILTILKELNKRGTTIVMITHDANVAKQANKVVYFSDGCIQSIVDNHKDNNAVVKESSPKKELSGRFRLPLMTTYKIIKNVLPEAAKNLLRSKTRSILTMLGIVIGIAAMLCMVTLGQFTKAKILESYTKLGANTLSIYGYQNWQQKATDTVSNYFQGFDIERDIYHLPVIFPQLESVSPALFSWGAKLNYSGHSIDNNVFLIGVGRKFLNIINRPLLLGKNFNDYAMENHSPVCIVGYDIAKRLFSNHAPIGEIVHINQQQNSFSCHVVGVLKKISTNKQGQDPNKLIIVPYSYFLSVITVPWQRQVHNLFVAAKPGVDVQKLGDGIRRYFDDKYGKSGQFSIGAESALLAQMQKFLNLFTMMLATIALVSLAVGGIGIMNMMLVSVTERFKEIGLRKAVGATDASLRIQYLIEAVLLCCLAGMIGLTLGFAGYEAIIYTASKFVKELPFVWLFDTLAISLSILSMILIGIVSGLAPALKAEKLQVVSALRSE